ncbi:type IV pilus modification protein PilV [Aquabacterium sp.]|uniref:type IV pilus modification protein PilV n=1 Tax=Aquabacterium sp. TaxID=1872578 RepID=UPI0024871B9C|nr:type IV pilus modification protein PilV [Aquabacterium sp.]MDI1348544.1 type IV pilus modification protein PilV [Aquabacterium sp.]
MNLPARSQSGVSLIEVLVSMLVLALGMVGLAALQARTVSYQLGSGQRAQLSGLLADYAERVRSNLNQAPGVAASSDYLYNATWSDQAADVAAASVDCAASGVSCTGAALASYDMAQWRAAVRRGLPQGSVRVTGDAHTGIEVTFMWTDKDRTQDGVNGRTLVASAECATSTTGMARQSCCPGGVPDGTRCANFMVVP